MTDISVVRTSDYNDAQYFEHLSPSGHVTCVYREKIGQYTIAEIEVEEKYRRQGMGKMLLRSSLEHAKQIKASYLVSFIISRECLDAMTSVFGVENVQITQAGRYGDDVVTEEDATSAMLYYELDDRHPENLYAKLRQTDQIGC